MSEFIDWLQQELNDRGWSYSELARRAGMTGANVSQTLGGKQGITFNFVSGVADALGYDPVDLFIRAGLLRGVRRAELDADTEREWLEIMRRLSVSERRAVLEWARWMMDRARGGNPAGNHQLSTE